MAFSKARPLTEQEDRLTITRSEREALMAGEGRPSTNFRGRAVDGRDLAVSPSPSSPQPRQPSEAEVTVQTPRWPDFLLDGPVRT
jgi:hypothetical protein